MNATREPTLADYWELTRPFTLLAPFIGFFSLAIAGWTGQERLTFLQALPFILLGAFSAACLNAASNIINQYFDLEIDRINKPARPLPSGRVPISSALILCAFLYGLTFITAWFVNLQFFWIVLFTAFITYAYSGPPFRTKRHWFWANLTIAIPRGCLLVVAGWTAVRDIRDAEPWVIGLVFGLYILGAATTKDFADIEGDRQGGCITMPIRFGVETCARLITPFFIFPFLVLLLAAVAGVFQANNAFMALLALVLMVWGAYVAWLILRRPSELATEANHVSWKHMYLIMVLGQLGIAAAYLLH